MSERPTNALATETSPYLLQHAHNPVDWRPWGPDALERAKEQNKPIFLSIGYAACHWCHVMEHESFEDPEVARILNEHFIPVKVDREERPDLDEIYMAATMLFTGGHGGWPMSVFLAPDLRPIYAGTYFPKEDSYGRPGFTTLISLLARKWREESDALLADSDKVVDLVRQLHKPAEGGDPPRDEDLHMAARQVYRAFDQTLGGVSSGSNKFPPSLALDLLLRRWRRTGEPAFLGVAELTLEQMGNGGIYDHLGGGIHRYATDLKWLVPHFEKMLYDQALVASAYVGGWQATKRPELKELFEERARGICDYVLRDLRSREGAFFSSEDADSEGLEGKFYIWSIEQIQEALDDRTARIFCSHYDVTEYGNWMHAGDGHVPRGPKNILHVARSLETIAELDVLDVPALKAQMFEARQTLLKVRSDRPRPGLDDKILTGWNGLMIGALARAAAAFEEPRYAQAAQQAALFIVGNLQRDGRLLAVYGKGRARLTAYSTDYAFLIEGLLELFQTTADFRWLGEAERLTDVLVEHYADDEAAGFFLTARDHEELLVRSRAGHDGATPSANSVMLGNLLKLHSLLDRRDFGDRAERLVRSFGREALKNPFQSERMLAEIDAWRAGLIEIVVAGDPAAEDARDLLRAARSRFLPGSVIVPFDPRRAAEAPPSGLFGGRTTRDGRAVAYVCRGGVCQQPAATLAEFAEQLDGAIRARSEAQRAG